MEKVTTREILEAIVEKKNRQIETKRQQIAGLQAEIGELIKLTDGLKSRS